MGLFPDTIEGWREITARVEAEDRAKAAEQDRLADHEARRAHICHLLESNIQKYAQVEILEELESRHLSKTTAKGYRSDFARFRKFAADLGVSHLPADPEIVAGYLFSECAEVGMSAITRSAHAIGYFHRLVDYPDPTKDPLVGAVLRYGRRYVGTKGAENE